MVKILAIGNSFSTDATAYLHSLAKRGGIQTKVVNLFVGGCSLSMHCENIKNESKNYVHELNGTSDGRLVTLKEALLEDDWDYIITHQASYDSGVEESYYPFMGELWAFVERFCPKAERVINQTWAYETDSTHGAFETYEKNQILMYERLTAAYKKAAEKFGLRLIPSGEVIQTLRTKPGFIYSGGGKSLCRDGFHLSHLYGRFAVSAAWYEFLLGGNILENPYIPPDNEEEGSPEPNLIQTARDVVHNVCSSKK